MGEAHGAPCGLAAHPADRRSEKTCDAGGVNGSTAYQVRGLEKSYRGAPEPANRDIDLDVPAGAVFGLLGPNGAGKTTLVRQLVGLVRPDAGSLSLFGYDLLATRRSRARLVGLPRPGRAGARRPGGPPGDRDHRAATRARRRGGRPARRPG